MTEEEIRFKLYCQTIKDKIKNGQKPHNERYKQGFFIPKNPKKCMNIMETNEPQPIVFRSGWEKDFLNWLDKTDSITRWGSEIVKILYKDPIRNKETFYIPDAYFEVVDKSQKLKKYLIEIKPIKETKLKEASNGYDKLMVAKNAMKWASAIQFCKKRGIEFKVLSDSYFKNF